MTRRLIAAGVAAGAAMSRRRVAGCVRDGEFYNDSAVLLTTRAVLLTSARARRQCNMQVYAPGALRARLGVV